MRRRSPDVLAALVVLTASLAATAAPSGADASGAPGSSPGFLTLNATKSKEPITITSDNLEYQYQDGIVIYRGDVLAVQGDVKVKSNELRITLVKSDDSNGKKVTAKAATDLDNADASKLQTVVATGSVRIDQGTKWAVAGKATFDQTKRTLVLTENPVVHDGPNEVLGDRITVYMDENRSIVEGGPKRVKATLIPGKKDETGAAGTEKKDGSPGAKPTKAATSEVASPVTAR
jgi:lipopolysaccharide export system protein LptA